MKSLDASSGKAPDFLARAHAVFTASSCRWRFLGSVDPLTFVRQRSRQTETAREAGSQRVWKTQGVKQGRSTGKRSRQNEK